MRQFYLKNGNGAVYSFMDKAHWLYEPKGLGLNLGDKYSQVGSNFIRTKPLTKPKEIEGTLVFTGENQYQDYHDFMSFAQIEPLVFIYNPYGTEFQVNVSLESIKKEEIDYKTGFLMVELEFKRLTRWRRVIIQRNDGLTEGKIYTYTYPYKYGSDVAQNVTIESDTAMESPCKITIIGTCENPVWRLYVNNELKLTGKLNASIASGQRVVIDTTQIPYSIKKYDNSNHFLADLYQDSDFSTDRFFFLEKGINRISIGHDGASTLELAVEAHLEYETV